MPALDNPKASSDVEITCVTCGATFVFTTNERAWMLEKGFDREPRRCVPCRAERRRQRDRARSISHA